MGLKPGEDTCPTCGADHEGICPYGVQDTCPVCGERECICQILEDFPLGPDSPNLPTYPFEEYDSLGAEFSPGVFS